MAGREAYVPPARQADAEDGDANINTHSSRLPSAAPRLRTGREEHATPDQKVYYICDACNVSSGFKANDSLRCLNCGGVTMFKTRVKRIFQHSAI